MASVHGSIVLHEEDHPTASVYQRYADASGWQASVYLTPTLALVGTPEQVDAWLREALEVLAEAHTQVVSR